MKPNLLALLFIAAPLHAAHDPCTAMEPVFRPPMERTWEQACKESEAKRGVRPVHQPAPVIDYEKQLLISTTQGDPRHEEDPEAQLVPEGSASPKNHHPKI